MGRKANKIQPYDFSDFTFDTADMVHKAYPTDAALLTRLEFIDAHKAHDDYYLKRNIQQMKNGTLFSQLNRWVKRNIVSIVWRYEDTLQAQEVARFQAWYSSRQDAQETWRECIPNVHGLHSFSRYYNSGRYGSQEDRDDWAKLTESGPTDGYMWQEFTNVYGVKDWIELHRNPKYEVGDLVLLRKAYVGKWRYDPMSEVDEATPRYGTVMEYKEATGGTRRSSRGRGTRTVSVLWMGKQDIVDVMEKTIKLECRKGHKMGKV